MSDEFRSPERRIARAKEHIADLQREAGLFFDSKPFSAVIEPHSDGIQKVHKIKFTKTLPDALSDRAAEAADSLRSALDQACYTVCRAAMGGDPKNTHFPFADTAQGIDDALSKGRSKDIPQDIATLLRGFKPYKGGNDLLWGLNRMRIANQHKLLVPIAVAAGGSEFVAVEGAGPYSLMFPNFDRLKNESILAITGTNSKLQYQIKVSFQVTFDEVDALSGKEAIGTLNALAGEIEGILAAIKAESRRIGLIA
jgi:hypothetical protein